MLRRSCRFAPRFFLSTRVSLFFANNLSYKLFHQLFFVGIVYGEIWLLGWWCHRQEQRSIGSELDWVSSIDQETSKIWQYPSHRTNWCSHHNAHQYWPVWCERSTPRCRRKIYFTGVQMEANGQEISFFNYNEKTYASLPKMITKIVLVLIVFKRYYCFVLHLLP